MMRREGLIVMVKDRGHNDEGEGLIVMTSGRGSL